MNIPESIKEEIRNKGYSIKERYFVLKRKAPLGNHFSLREGQVEWIAGDEDRDSFLPMTSDDALSEAKKAYELTPSDRSKHSDSDFFGDEGVEDGNGDFIFKSDLSDNEWISVEWDSVDKVFIGSNNEEKNIH